MDELAQHQLKHQVFWPFITLATQVQPRQLFSHTVNSLACLHGSAAAAAVSNVLPVLAVTAICQHTHLARARHTAFPTAPPAPVQADATCKCKFAVLADGVV